MKKPIPHVLVALLVVAAAIALLISRCNATRPAAEAPAPEPVLEGADEPGPAASPERADAGRAAVDPFDCVAPIGDVARVDGEAISARELCHAWRRIAGLAEHGGPGVIEQQGRALLEAMIDARLVHRALASAGKEVAERDVDAALDALIAQQHGGSRAAFEQALRAQGSEAEEARAELRRRLERERLVELRKPTEPQRVLDELRAQAKIERLRW